MKQREGKHQIAGQRVYDWRTTTSKVNFTIPAKPASAIAKVDTYQYNTLSDGVSAVYTNADELTEYGNRGILNPQSVSYINLYINGMLQPPNTYHVKTGELRLNTTDIPSANTPIVLQFITIHLGE